MATRVAVMSPGSTSIDEYNYLGKRIAGPISVVVTAIIASVAGCKAPDKPAQPAAETQATAESPSIVTVELQNSLHRPVILSDDNLRYVQNRVGQLATASKLEALTDTSANEVRIWQSAATFDGPLGYETVGYVVTASRASRCKIDYPEDGQPPFKAECTVMRNGLGDLDAAPLLEPLLPYANTDMGCGVVDGVWYDMEIVHNGKRFVISASNPDSCTDDGSNSVSALIEAVYRLK